MLLLNTFPNVAKTRSWPLSIDASGVACHCRAVLVFVVIGLLTGPAFIASGSEPSVEKIAIDDVTYMIVRRHDRSSNATVVIFQNGEELQSMECADFSHPPDIAVEDYNFDGHQEFSLFGSMGAAVLFRDVFLFDPESGRFVRNEALSDLPCIQVDVENSLVLGACFHGSPCENWQEAYSVSGFDNLVLKRRWGTECGSAAENHYYTFDITYENGEIVSEQRIRHSF